MVTAAVLARDEEAFIGRCLRSLAWADEVLVLLDAASRDATEAIARAAGARVERRPFRSFPAQRNLALDLAGGDWVLFVDADEWVSPDLAEEVRSAVGGSAAGYWVPRRNRIIGRWMRGTGWFPDEQLRLLRRGRARYDERQLVHEVARVEGEIGRLRAPLLHFNYATFPEFWAKQRCYAELAARSRAEVGPPRWRALLGAPAREFWRRFVTLRGYRDGALGLLLSLALAYFEWQTVRRARALGGERTPTRGPESEGRS